MCTTDNVFCICFWKKIRFFNNGDKVRLDFSGAKMYQCRNALFGHVVGPFQAPAGPAYEVQFDKSLLENPSNWVEKNCAKWKQDMDKSKKYIKVVMSSQLRKLSDSEYAYKVRCVLITSLTNGFKI